MGIVVLVYQSLGLIKWIPILAPFGVPSLSISVSLNVLLILMIVTRNVLHGRSPRPVTSQAGISGLYTAISTRLIESHALFTRSSLVVIGLLVTGHYVADTFSFILADTLVRPIPVPQSELEANVRTGRTGYRTAADCVSRRLQEHIDDRSSLQETPVRSTLGTEGSRQVAIVTLLVRIPWVSLGCMETGLETLGSRSRLGSISIRTMGSEALQNPVFSIKCHCSPPWSGHSRAIRTRHRSPVVCPFCSPPKLLAYRRISYTLYSRHLHDLFPALMRLPCVPLINND